MTAQLPYKPATGEIPTNPGVYRFLGADGRVLYVGKAKNLRQRLSNYFAPLHTLHERTRRMVTTAVNVEWTVVPTDVDSLQLEYQWIKQFDPPFNVKYRDDKSYPFLAVTLADEAPRVMVTRNRKIRGAKYFGPYPKVWAVRDTIDLMLKVFPIRTCSDSSYKRAMTSGKPCFPGQIGKCGGPCSGRVSIEEHRAIVGDFVAFMQGGDERFAREVMARMKEAAAALDFESAAVYRDQLESIDAVLTKSALVLPDNEDADLFGLAEDELDAAVHHFVIRGGRVRGASSQTVDKELDITSADLVEQILQRAYGDADAADVPRRVIVPFLPDAHLELEQFLAARRGRRVEIQVAQRGQRAELMRNATLNATQALVRHKTKRTSDYSTRTQALADLQEALGMTEAPLRIECYDISHLQGTNVVGSMVVFEDGLPRKDQYRSFSIAETTDDTDSMHQVLTRRLARLDDPQEDEPTGRPRFSYPPPAASRRRRPAAGERRGSRARGVGAHRDRARRHREKARGALASGRRLSRDPAAHVRGALPGAATARRGASLRDRAPAQEAAARHPLDPRRDPGSRRGAHQGAAHPLRVCYGVARRDGRADRGIAGHRPEACGNDPRASRARMRLSIV